MTFYQYVPLPYKDQNPLRPSNDSILSLYLYIFLAVRFIYFKQCCSSPGRITCRRTQRMLAPPSFILDCAREWLGSCNGFGSQAAAMVF